MDLMIYPTNNQWIYIFYILSYILFLFVQVGKKKRKHTENKRARVFFNRKVVFQVENTSRIHTSHSHTFTHNMTPMVLSVSAATRLFFLFCQ